jgi:hypothetical protein
VTEHWLPFLFRDNGIHILRAVAGGTRMTRHKGEWRKLRKGLVRTSDLDNLMNILLALDRTVVELSMHVYKIPRGQQVAMREQNRILHEAFRDRLPRALSRRAAMAQSQESMR